MGLVESLQPGALGASLKLVTRLLQGDLSRKAILIPESARRPPVPSHSGTEAPTQGTSFLRLCDSHVMRFTTLWHATAEDGWEATFGFWKRGALNLRTRDSRGEWQNSWFGWCANQLHPEVADRILRPAHRRSLVLPELVDYWRDRFGESAKPILRIGALEALRVEERADGACSVILVVHSVVPTDDYQLLRDNAIRRGAMSEIGAFIHQILDDPSVCGTHPLRLAPARGGLPGWFAPPVFTLAWVPIAHTAQWAPGADETAEQLSERMKIAVSADAMEQVRAELDAKTPQVALKPCLLALSGWQWGDFPPSGSAGLRGEEYAVWRDATHILSQNWGVAVGENGAAYLPRQEDPFLREAMLRAFSIDFDVYLPVVLDRLRVRAISQSLAATAQELRTWSHRDDDSPQTIERLDALIDQAIALDSDAVAFLASEWWTDIADHQRVDRLLSWTQQACQLDDAVAQVVQQARLLREAVQTILDREEHRVELERREIERQRKQVEEKRQESSRMIEAALAVLTVVGVPVTIFIDIWIGWDPTQTVGRGYVLPFFGTKVPWIVIALIGALSSLGLGYFGYVQGKRWVRRAASNSPQRKGRRSSAP